MHPLPVFLVCLAPVLTFGQISKEITLTLVEEEGFNEVKIDLDVSAIGDSDDTSDLSGTMTVRVNIFPGLTTTNELTVLSADIEGSDVELSAGNFLASYEFGGKDLGFSAFTTSPPGIADLATGEFEASQHEVTVNQGSLNGSASTLLTGTEAVDYDFREDNFTGQGEGTGTVTITQGRIEGRKFYFDVSVELPTNIEQTIEVEGAPVDADVKIGGTLKATGETFIEIPDYATWAAKSGIEAASGNEFDITPSNPNFILFALGFDRETAPQQLFKFSTAGATLEVNEILAAGAIEIQWSNDLITWDLVPETSMVNGKNTFNFGDSLSEEITVSKVGTKKFLRISPVTPG
jgi:hypothetical protein